MPCFHSQRTFSRLKRVSSPKIQEMYMGLALAFAGLARASKLSWHAPCELAKN